MKKFSAFILVVCVLLLSFSMIVFAQGDSSIQSDEGEGNVAVFDTRRMPHKEFSPSVIDNTMISAKATNSGGWWSAHCYKHSATSTSYTDKNKTKRWAISKIGARFRGYRGNSLVESGSDTQYGSSYAGASDPNTTVTNLKSSIGNHTFEMTGYESWYPETYWN